MIITTQDWIMKAHDIYHTLSTVAKQIHAKVYNWIMLDVITVYDWLQINHYGTGEIILEDN